MPPKTPRGTPHTQTTNRPTTRLTTAQRRLVDALYIAAPQLNISQRRTAYRANNLAGQGISWTAFRVAWCENNTRRSEPTAAAARA